MSDAASCWPKPFPLSQTADTLSDGATFDVVVVGSGYGGAIAAYRLAAAGWKVCVLERGREILPAAWAKGTNGTSVDPTLVYPDTLEGVAAELQVHTERGGPADGTGLFDLRVGQDVSVLVGCGLGGTSLINANVALPADRRVFEQDAWPVAFRMTPDLLQPYYQEARRRLGSNPYPSPEVIRPSAYPVLNKVAALEAAANATDRHFSLPPINVTFEDGPNAFGVEQKACVLCGDCVTGCNYGAKNTTLMNYLPAAKVHGAEIFTLAAVDDLQQTPDEKGWILHVRDLTALKPRSHTPLQGRAGLQPLTPRLLTITASVVVLAAGTLGSTEILLRSKKKNLSVSDAVGTRFSTNGDAFAYGYDNDWNARAARPQVALRGEARQPIYGVGSGNRLSPTPDAVMAADPALRPGPCIAGLIDARDPDRPLRDGLVIEEGVIPSALAAVIPPLAFLGDTLTGNFFEYADTRQRLQDAQELGTAIRDGAAHIADAAYRGPVSRSQTYLVMSHDAAAGTLVLDETGHVHVSWEGAGDESVFVRDDRILRGVNQAIRGNFLPDPLWSEALGRKLITVHPLGGCPMADTGERGAVNDRGQVFRDSTTANVYPNLYVCDGSIIPTSLGVNPLLTIAALAERAAELMTKEHPTPAPLSDARAAEPRAEVVVHPSAADPGSAATPFGCDSRPTLIEALVALLVGGTVDDFLTFPGALTPFIAVEAKERALSEVAKLGLPPADIPQGMIDELITIETKGITQNVTDTIVTPLADGAIAWYCADANGRAQLFDSLASQLAGLVERFPAGFSPTLEFDERMVGFVSDRALPHPPEDASTVSDPYEVAYRYGAAAPDDSGRMTARFHVTSDDLNRLLSTRDHPATVTGHVECPAVSPDPMDAQGTLELLLVDTERVEVWKMIYSIQLATTPPLVFSGTKIVHRRPRSTPWSDLTTLYVTVSEPGQPVGEPGARAWRGILHLGLVDLVEQARSLQVAQRPQNVLGSIVSEIHDNQLLKKWADTVRKELHDTVEPPINAFFQARLAQLFADAVFRTYGGLLAYLENFPATHDAHRQRRVLEAPTPQSHPLRTADGVELLLTRYPASKPGAVPKPVILAPGFMTAASSFAADTVSQNLIEYLATVTPDYDVWLFDYRGSPALGAPPEFTVDDIAACDWPAAVDYVCAVAGADQVQVLAHCVGSLTFLMALLRDGTGTSLRPKILSAICSQLTIHPVTDWLNYAKIDLDLVGLLENDLRVRDVDLISTRTPASELLDVWLWSVPVPPGEECTNPLCRRVFSVFGPSWTHAQLNAATHDALREWFGSVYLSPLRQLAMMMRKGYAVDRDGRDAYRPNVQNLAGLPLTFVAGGQNQLFRPEGSAITLEWLRKKNPDSFKQGLYTRRVFSPYAHMDHFIGRAAHEDIFPFLVRTLAHPPS